MLRIISAQWSPAVNLLWLTCDNCNTLFRRRADRWRVRCVCGVSAHLACLRRVYVAEKGA